MSKAKEDDLQEQIRELQVFRNKAQQLFEHIPALIISRKGKVLQINETAEQTLKLSAKQLVGKTLYSAGCRVVDENGLRVPVRKQPWHQSIKRNAMVSNVVTGIILPDGTCQWQQSTSMPLHGRSAVKPDSSITMFADITKFRMTQAQMQQSHKMEAIGSLASGLAHDFNNVLTSIRSSVQLILVDKNEASQDYETLKDIENGALAGAELIKQLLLFSKPSHSSKSKTTNLNNRIGLLRRLLRRTMPKNIKIDLDLTDDNVVVRIDPTQLEQILLNLAINSRDAMHEGGVFRISTTVVSWNKSSPGPVSNAEHGLYAKIDVADNGVGIPAEVADRLFEPFCSSKNNESGTGLGLSIVYAIVQRQRGYIMVNSSAGLGTTMTIYLPARHAVRRTQRKSETTVMPMGGHEKILVVDDEELITKSTARFLVRYGYSVITAYDGVSALKLFRKHRDEVKLVLLDLEMPEMNGRNCMEQIFLERPNTKVIAFSGHILKEREWEPVKAGASAFVQKPFDFADLLAVIRSTLDDR